MSPNKVREREKVEEGGTGQGVRKKEGRGVNEEQER